MFWTEFAKFSELLGRTFIRFYASYLTQAFLVIVRSVNSTFNGSLLLIGSPFLQTVSVGIFDSITLLRFTV